MGKYLQVIVFQKFAMVFSSPILNMLLLHVSQTFFLFFIYHQYLEYHIDLEHKKIDAIRFMMIIFFFAIRILF